MANENTVKQDQQTRQMSKQPSIKQGKLNDFRPAAKNANLHTERGMAMLEREMGEVGYVAPITVAADGESLDGSARLEKAYEVFGEDAIVIEHDGTRPVVMVRTDIASAEAPMARRIQVGANRIAEVNLDWDADLLLADLEGGLDLSGLFGKDELDELLKGIMQEEPPEDPGAQMDRAAELREKWGTALGQIWQLGEHRLAVGDCTDRAVMDAVTREKKAGAVVTDPPYGVAYDPKWRGDTLDQTVHGASIEGDKGFEWLHVFKEIPADVLYVWLASNNIARVQLPLETLGFETRYLIVWNKDLAVMGRGNYHWKHELCLYMVREGAKTNWQGARNETTVWDIPTIHSFKRGHNAEEWELLGHANQKPLECMERPIRNNTAKGEIVLDPFVGSGTTLIACERLNRRCRAIEIEPKYCAVTIQRWVDMTAKEPKLIDS